MFKHLATAKLGIFIFLGSTLLVAAIFLLGNKDALFKSTFTVKTYFKNIEGLRNGAVVRLSGIDVGSVKSIEIADDTTGRIEVSMRLITDIERFIRKDTKASIETEGLVGNKVIILQIGTSASEQVKDGGVIQSKEPLGFAAIIEETQGIMEYTKEMTKNLSEIVGRVNRGEGSIGKLLNDEELYNNATQLTLSADKSLNAITSELEEVTEIFKELGSGVKDVVNNVNLVVVDVDTIISGIKQGKGMLGSLVAEKSDYDSLLKATLNNVQKIAEDGKLAASRLAENMEALKHNWLFKSYFEERGYWDKAEYEDQINNGLIELDKKIKMLDERIETLKSFEQKK
jgi:phospholipid/cholesterol/gamma-HCH transport system substrate-binding protein